MEIYGLMINDEKKDEDEKVVPGKVEFDNTKDIYDDTIDMVQQSEGPIDIVLIEDEHEVSLNKDVLHE